MTLEKRYFSILLPSEINCSVSLLTMCVYMLLHPLLTDDKYFLELLVLVLDYRTVCGKNFAARKVGELTIKPSLIHDPFNNISERFPSSSLFVINKYYFGKGRI